MILFFKFIQAGDINNDLIDACRLGDVERTTVNLECGAHVHHQDEVSTSHLMTNLMLFILTGLALQRGRSALWLASDAGETECVKLLLKYGAQVDLPVRCDVQKWIQDCGVLFGQTSQLLEGSI